jgi:hypothetical protein
MQTLPQWGLGKQPNTLLLPQKFQGFQNLFARN